MRNYKTKNVADLVFDMVDVLDSKLSKKIEKNSFIFVCGRSFFSGRPISLFPKDQLILICYDK